MNDGIRGWVTGRMWLAAALALGCGGSEPDAAGGATALVGATLFDATGGPAIENAVLVVRDGRVEAVGPASEVPVPDGAEEIDVSGRFIVPGTINAHGHVGGTLGLETDRYDTENLLRQLRLYARYGVTTVVSLGGDGEAGAAIRDAEPDGHLDRARLRIAGDVVVGDTPEEARAVVAANAAVGADFIKIRVDDNLGTTAKMTPDVYEAVIRDAGERGMRVASHLFYLDDAKALLRAGTGFVAHSIRDRAVDDEVIGLFRERNVCYSPTLTREVSTFVYESEPEFFSDPFFLQYADPAVLDQLRDPERQRGVRESEAAQRYKEALEVAKRNVKALADAGVTIALGTDTGPPARFQGYFEHMEMDLMAEAGLTPMQILMAATANPARCLGLEGVGTLAAGNWADFVVLSADPLTDIGNMRSIESVWVAGGRIGG